MYEAHWQLDEKPFENVCDRRFYFPGAAHQGALLKLRYAIESRRGPAVLVGPSGAGKTMLVEALGSQLGDRLAPRVRLVFPQMPPEQLVAWLAEEIAERCGWETRSDSGIRRLEQLLQKNAAAGQHALVVIDEAQLLADPRSLETLRLLMNFEHQGQPALSLLLVGQPELLPAIERMPALDQRIGVKCLLRPLTAAETAAYIRHRLSVAGAADSLFDDEAIERLHQLAQGIPRQINRLCDLALLIGYADEQSRLTAAQVEAVGDELFAVAPE